jgi:large subunit ribosomal protein L6
MSRIGKKPISVPKGVEVEIDGQRVKINGPKGTSRRELHPTVSLKHLEGVLVVEPRDSLKENKRFYGLSRTLVNNMVVGVTEGFTKGLTLVGVGYRAAIKGDELQLTLGYSHPVVHKVPVGIEIRVDKQTSLLVLGADKELVGQTAADIRAYRAPEPYHGKGVRYADEVIATKVGKSAGKK